MYIKYIVNYWSVSLCHDIQSKTNAIYFELGLVARGDFVAKKWRLASVIYRTCPKQKMNEEKKFDWCEDSTVQL